MPDTTSKDDELDINKYPRAITSPMATFEIAVGEYEQSSKSEHFYKKLRVARTELAEAITRYGIQEYKKGFSDGQDSLLDNGQINLYTEQDLKAYSIQERKRAENDTIKEMRAIIKAVHHRLSEAKLKGRKYLRITELEHTINKSLLTALKDNNQKGNE